MFRRFFALFITLFLLTAGTLPALAAGAPPANGNSDDDYIVGSVGPIEVLRPFLVKNATLQLMPSWGGYFFPVQTVAQGSVEITNTAPVPFGLALWADPGPSSRPGPGANFQVANIRAARLDSGGNLSPWVDIVNYLTLGHGEVWTVKYQIVVDPYSWGGKVDRIDVRIDHIPLCTGSKGTLKICGMGD